MLSFLRGSYLNISPMNLRCCYSPRSFSTALPPVHLPSRMETHLWYVVPNEVKSASLLSQYMELLPQSERDHVLSFRGDQLQKSALLARTLVRTTIARYQVDGHLDPRSLRFKRNIHGKPEVEWQSKDDWYPPPLHFNISHTSSLVACGVAVNSSIGIDVEEKQRKTKHGILAFAKRYFSAHEVEHLNAIPDLELQQQEFIKLWTLKEAYVKALGKGFSSAPFKTFTIRVNTAVNRSFHRFNQESGIVVESVDNPQNHLTNVWQFAVLELTGSHYVSICLETEKINGAGNAAPIKLTARRTIPFVEDELVSGTNSVVTVGGFVKQL
ncbi:4'-phosphopantetheinyl transferase Sfp [Linum perenne]